MICVGQCNLCVAIVSFLAPVIASSSCDAAEVCMNDENAAECTRLRALCGDALLVMESCPVQFSCPIGATCDPEDECMDDESVAECTSMRDLCGDAMMSTRSCPPQFFCGSTDNNESISEDICDASGACMNDDNSAECTRLRESCGDALVVLKSCPSQFSCPGTNNNDSISEDICDASGACMNDDNSAECTRLRESCGDALVVLESCPLQFFCLGTDNNDSISERICDASGACMNDENSAECTRLRELCGDNLMVLESCPLQFSCAGLVNAGSSSCSLRHVFFGVLVGLCFEA